jgi:microsomal dipeptidase-like Zn-dependent dipeptidase
MMSLQHFFDNKLGGSLHGETKQGLTQFGEQAVDRMISKGIMIDVAHSSEAVVRDVLARSNKPLIVSHTGFKGHCDTERNISDETMDMVAEAGGLIGVGYWAAAVCDQSVGAIVASLRYGIDTFGLEHIALGSDWDGAVHTPIDAANIARLTQAMLDAEFSETEIRAVMGGNMLRFLLDQLPRA